MAMTLRFARRVLAVALLVSAPPAVTRALPQGATSKDLPTVWVLATGGTISGKGASPTSLTEYKAGALLGEELIGSMPEIKQVANVKVEQIVNVGSPNIMLAHWLTLAARINAIFASDPGAAGVVITHGTNTLEETAYFLNLTVKDDRPVVLVGAQRPATAMSADGPLNLLNAIRTASAPEARGKGVLIVMNDEINAARDVTKTNTYRVEAFRTPELGFLGYVDADKVSFYRAPTKRHTSRSEFAVSASTQLPKVEIVYSYVEPSTAMLRSLFAEHVQGIVFAGTGAGGISGVERAALKQLLSTGGETMPVLVRSSRVGNGRVLSSREDDEMGMIPADTLNPQKARILLMLALTKTRDLKEIKRMFAEY
ncbi:MAG TPA: asparaginase [Vicinamibacterales bacterium]|nr:asparaginase [Vicinamibacterales bacterium]